MSGGRHGTSSWLAAAGFAIAFFASWCGIGGGLFAVPLLHFVRGLELRRAVATGLVLVLATTAAATGAELLQPAPSLRLPLVAALVLGVLVGAGLGWAVGERLRARLLRRVFVVVFVAAGLRVLLVSGGEGASAGSAIGPVELLLVAAVGLGGGFVAPILGVGGGLLMVPGLHLAAGLGFEEARASSLAAGVFAAGRSLALHARAGRVERSAALPLGLGALAGAAAGVLALERWELFGAGRVLLGLVLLGVAARFALHEWRGRLGGDPAGGRGDGGRGGAARDDQA